MSCCDRGASNNGAFPRRYSGGCNCSRGQGHIEEKRCCEPEVQNWTSRIQKETISRSPTGGCGRPNCPKIVYPPSEEPEVEWEYTNYNRKNHQWPTTLENRYPEYSDDSIQEEQNNQLNDSYNDNFNEGNRQYDCDYSDRIQEDNHQSYERVSGGCEDPSLNDGDNYLDYYYDEEPIDYQNSNTGHVSNVCQRCGELRDSRERESCGKKRVHF